MLRRDGQARLPSFPDAGPCPIEVEQLGLAAVCDLKGCPVGTR